MAKNVDFETSSELKKLFNQELDAWCARHKLGLEELSARCGVSRSYLAHIGRYGRIPSKPVLLLLALNFGMKDPSTILRAAKIDEPWPFDRGAEINRSETPANGFLSVKLDMEGFVDAIKGVVRDQIRPRTIREILGDRPLRIGLNTIHPWMFETNATGRMDPTKGFMPELCHLLGSSLGCPVSIKPVPYGQYVDALALGEIDLFGPVLSIPEGPAKAFFSIPINRLGLSALMRLRTTAGLDQLSAPDSFDQIRGQGYVIAVVRNSRAHLIANMRLNRPDDTLIVCDSVEEALDRLVLTGVNKPAHIFICTTISAHRYSEQHPNEVSALFDTASTLIEMADNTFAIRRDWAEAVPIINQALQFVLSSGGFARRAEQLAARNLRVPQTTIEVAEVCSQSAQVERSEPLPALHQISPESSKATVVP
jgi:ABC-type amino acid transport substrate-binding protein